VSGASSFGQIFTKDTPESKNMCICCVFRRITDLQIAGASPPYATAETYHRYMGQLAEGWYANGAIASILFYFLAYGYELANTEVRPMLITGRLANGNLRAWLKHPRSTLPAFD
jgi:hypothetical protein